MPAFNLENFLANDSQNELVRKLNSNFSQIVEFYGGTLSNVGVTGERGPIGQRGPKGPTGNTGKRGTRWFVSPSEPAGGSETIEYGDFWLDENGDVYVFSSSGWNFFVSISDADQIFKTVTGVLGPAGATSGIALTFNQNNPNQFSFVFADDVYTYTNLNPQSSKFVISTNPSLSNYYLVEFTRNDVEPTGPTGSTGDSVRHPFFYWLDGSSSPNLGLSVPDGSLEITYNDSTVSNSDFEINSSGNVVLFSESNFKILSGSNGNQNWSATGPINFTGRNVTIIGSGISIQSTISSYSGNVELNPLVVPTASGFLRVNSSVAGATSAIFEKPLGNISVSANGDSILKTTVNGSTEFSVDTAGKTLTKKLIENYSERDTASIRATATSGANSINWFDIQGMGASSDYPQFGNSLFISPVNNMGGTAGSAFVGVGLQTQTTKSLMANLTGGESITIKALCSKNPVGTNPNSIEGFSFIGFFSGTGAPSSLNTNYWSLNGVCKQIDISIYKIGGIGTNTSSVYWQAYGATASSSGSFSIS